MKSITTIAIAIVGVVLTGVIGAVASPDQAASILSFTGGLVIVLVASLREQQKTHAMVNSRMDQLLAASRRADLAEGEEMERERVKRENEQGA